MGNFLTDFKTLGQKDCFSAKMIEIGPVDWEKFSFEFKTDMYTQQYAIE